jgi:CheY-like chemotaxis protein
MNIKILIIEDELDLQQNFKEILEIKQFEVEVAADGLEALDLLANNFFDLIICDIVMPGMNGMDFLAEVRKFPIYSNIPFIFLSGKSSSEDQRAGMELGADDYLLKPVTSKVLLKAVFSSLEKKRQREEWINLRLKSALKENQKITLHEFRTPLAGVLGVFDVMESLLDNFNGKEFKELIDIGKNSAIRINESLTKLSLFDGIENLSLNLSRLNFDLGFPESLFPHIRDKISIDHWDKNYHLMVDLKLFRFVIKEVIGNALRFVSLGSKIRLEFIEGVFKVSNYQQVNKDIGEYIPQAFSQVNRSYVEQQGLGLGLFLSHKIMLAHKGNMTCLIDSNFNFVVSLDLRSLNLNGISVS